MRLINLFQQSISRITSPVPLSRTMETKMNLWRAVNRLSKPRVTAALKMATMLRTKLVTMRKMTLIQRTYTRLWITKKWMGSNIQSNLDKNLAHPGTQARKSQRAATLHTCRSSMSHRALRTTREGRRWLAKSRVRIRLRRKMWWDTSWRCQKPANLKLWKLRASDSWARIKCPVSRSETLPRIPTVPITKQRIVPKRNKHMDWKITRRCNRENDSIRKITRIKTW